MAQRGCSRVQPGRGLRGAPAPQARCRRRRRVHHHGAQRRLSIRKARRLRGRDGDMSSVAAPTSERERPQRRPGVGNLYLFAHPQSIRSRAGRMVAIVVCLTIIGGGVIGEVGGPGNVTFGGFSLIAVLAATWTLPARLYLPIMLSALALSPDAYMLGGLALLTAQ